MPTIDPNIRVTAIEANDQYAADILTTAVEGGSNYWATFTKVEEAKLDGDSIASIVRVEGYDREVQCDVADCANGFIDDVGTACKACEGTGSARRFAVDLVAIKAAIAPTLAKVNSQLIAQIVRNDNDAASSDAIFQVAALGDVIYG